MPDPDAAGRAAVLGRPVAHSLSPVLHRAAYAALGLDWTYEAIDCDADGLPEVLAARADWAGFSCTMPLKRAVLDVASAVTPRAAAVGAGNTLVHSAHGWTGDNTDVAGVVGALTESGVQPRDVVVLGAGGTAQAVVVALATLGVTSCRVQVRDESRTSHLRATAERAGVALRIGPISAVGDIPDLIVSTLPGGAADALTDLRWTTRTALLDVVYDPWPTRLARAAASEGARVVSGALMLLHQAGEQVRLMTGRDAPVAQMRAALVQAAPGCGA